PSNSSSLLHPTHWTSFRIFLDGSFAQWSHRYRCLNVGLFVWEIRNKEKRLFIIVTRLFRFVLRNPPKTSGSKWDISRRNFIGSILCEDILLPTHNFLNPYFLHPTGFF